MLSQLKHAAQVYAATSLIRVAGAVLLTGALTQTAMADTTLDQYHDIVVAPKAPAVVQAAAKDLQYHLQKMTGREIPLVIGQSTAADKLHFYVGAGVVRDQDAAIQKLPSEGWMIRSVKDGLLLAGSTESGALPSYPAVPLFLEKHAGVRWLWPGESGEVIPRTPNLKIATLDESGTPEMKRRNFTYGYARYWDPTVKTELKTYTARARFGDQFRANFGHAWGALIPGNVYFKDHPEWFGMVTGQRVPLQLCVSNMELREEFTKRLLSVPANQKLDIVSVSASDGYGFCECDKCKAKGTTDQDYQNEAYWDFVNDVAQRVKAQRPGLGVGTFAYTISRNPPKKIKRLPDNVFLSMTTYAMQLNLPEERENYRRFVADWKSKGVKIVMREYWGMHYWMDLPVLFPKEIDTTFKLALDAGMIASYGETGKNFSTQAPNYYVVRQLMWNPKADVNQILDEFYAGFGPAAKPVRDYYETYESATRAAWNKYQIKGGYTEVLTNFGNIFTPELMKQASAHLDEATKAAGNDESLKTKIAFLRTGWEYTAVMGELLGLYDKLGRTGFPLETFEWQATAEARRFLLRKVNVEGFEYFEKRLKEPFTYTLADKDAWMAHAWELGQKRIELYNKNRHNWALDEGLLAQTYEGVHHPSLGKGIRRWHQTIGRYLGKTPEEITPLDYTAPPAKPAAQVTTVASAAH